MQSQKSQCGVQREAVPLCPATRMTEKGGRSKDGVWGLEPCLVFVPSRELAEAGPFSAQEKRETVFDFDSNGFM